MNFGRRDFFKMALGSSALAAGWTFSSSAQAATTPSEYKHTSFNKKGFRDSLVTVGTAGNRTEAVFLRTVASAQPDSPEYSPVHSCVTEISLKDGSVKQTPIPFGKGHAAMRLPNGNLVITGHHVPDSALLDPDHKMIKHLKAPEGYVFGGHAQYFPEQDLALLAVRFGNAQSIENTGRLLVFDTNTFTLQDQIDTKGIHPHEIRMLPGGKEFVVTHYGDVFSPHPNGLAFHVIEPKLTVFDAKSFEPLRHYRQPIDAIYTHMDVGYQGDVYAVTNQYIDSRNKKTSEILRKMKEYNIKHNFARSSASASEGRIAIPGGVIKVNPKNGEREEFLVSEAINLRSQSVAAHNASKRVFATYVYSNTLLMIDEGAKKVVPLDAGEFGLSQIRGVTELPNTDYIAVSDQESGLAIVNAYTLQPVKYFKSANMWAPHIFPA